MDNMYQVMLIINIAVSIFIGALSAILPSRTRRAFLFGVRVPEAVHGDEDCVRLRKTYVSSIFTWTVIIIALEVFQYLVWPKATILAAMYFPLFLAAAQLVIYVNRWKRAKALKAGKSWTPEPAPAEKQAGVGPKGSLRDVPWGYYAVSALIVLVCVIASLAVYPSLPGRIATHFDANMIANAWSDKSIGVVLMMPLVTLGTVALMAVCAVSLALARMQVSASDMALSLAQVRAFRRGMGHCMGILTLGITAGMALLSIPMLSPDAHIPAWITWALFCAPIIPIIVYPVRAGQSGMKLKPAITDADKGPASDFSNSAGSNGLARTNDDSKWILGMFYYNPDDPALFAADRFGMNVGFNYAKTAAKSVVIVFGAALVIFYVWITIVLARI